MLQDGAGWCGMGWDFCDGMDGWMDKTGWGRNGVLAAQCSTASCSLGLW